MTDQSVITASLYFFALCIIGTRLLATKLYGKLTGVLAAIAMAFNMDFWAYARTGASEVLFTTEIVFTPYLILMRKKWADELALLMLILLYFTRPQGFIFIASNILLWLLLKTNWKRAILIFMGICLLGLMFDKTLLVKYNGKDFLYTITGRGVTAVQDMASSTSPSESLRSSIRVAAPKYTALKKTANNLFNFYRLIPNIMSPYLFFLFIVSFFY